MIRRIEFKSLNFIKSTGLALDVTQSFQMCDKNSHNSDKSQKFVNDPSFVLKSIIPLYWYPFQPFELIIIKAKEVQPIPNKKNVALDVLDSLCFRYWFCLMMVRMLVRFNVSCILYLLYCLIMPTPIVRSYAICLYIWWGHYNLQYALYLLNI